MFKSNKRIKRNKGMTYVELIVVLSIFAVMTSVVLFNYRDFQTKVDIKNLASDIALKIVEAQKSSLSGKLPSQSYGPDWKPSYGVYFDTTASKQFIYFADLNNLNGYEAGETLDTISITKGNSISRIDSYTSAILTQQIVNPLSITFKRPDSRAVFSSNGLLSGFDYVQITITSPDGATKAFIKVYQSGRIQVN